MSWQDEDKHKYYVWYNIRTLDLMNYYQTLHPLTGKDTVQSDMFESMDRKQELTFLEMLDFLTLCKHSFVFAEQD